MQRYPLAWPVGWKRTLPHFRKSGNFKSFRNRITLHQAISRVLDELRRFGVLEGDSIISTNIPTRLDGLPRGDQREPEDPGIAVYWQTPGEPMRVMATDIYDRAADNIAAIAATLDAMRAIERHGGAQILERAFTGFDALPDPNNRNWRDVLGKDVTTRAELETVYKRLRSESHPDKGGNAERFHDVQRAYDDACKELRP